MCATVVNWVENRTDLDFGRNVECLRDKKLHEMSNLWPKGELGKGGTKPMWMNDHLKKCMELSKDHRYWKLGLGSEEVMSEMRNCATKVKIIPVDLTSTLSNKTKLKTKSGIKYNENHRQEAFLKLKTSSQIF